MHKPIVTYTNYETYLLPKSVNKIFDKFKEYNDQEDEHQQVILTKELKILLKLFAGEIAKLRNIDPEVIHWSIFAAAKPSGTKFFILTICDEVHADVKDSVFL
jgi:hypothetical protein